MATNISISEPPEFLRDYYAALAERGMNLGNLGFTPYDQQRIAPWNQQQQDAAQMVQQRALSGSPSMDQAQDWYSNMLAGRNNVGNVNAALGPSGISAPGQIGAISNQYLGAQSRGVAPSGQIGAVGTQYGPSGIASGGQIGGVSPTFGPSSIASGGQSTAGRNAYLGMNNPYLNTAISNAQDDVSGRVNSQFNNNAFGGTAHQQTLGRELGRISNDMRMQDYATQLGLSESDVARQLANQQYNIGNQNQLNQFNANLGFQNANIANQMGQFNSGVQGQNVANQNALNQFNANLGFQNAGIGNQMALANAGLQGQNIQNQNATNQFNANLGAADLARNAGLAQTQGQFNAGLQGQNIANTTANNQFNANLGFQNAGIQNQANQFNAGTQAANIGRQQQALGFAPTLAANDYADASALMGVGNQLQGTNQQIADANYQEFLRQQAFPGQQLGFMAQGLGAAGAGAGGTSTQTTNQQGSPIAGMIGGGLAGYGISNALGFTNPWLGAGIGTLGGGLLS